MEDKDYVHISTTLRRELLRNLEDAGIQVHRGFYKRILEDGILDMLNRKTQKTDEVKAEFDARLQKMQKDTKTQLDSVKNIINTYIVPKDTEDKKDDKN